MFVTAHIYYAEEMTLEEADKLNIVQTAFSLAYISLFYLSPRRFIEYTAASIICYYQQPKSYICAAFI